MAEQKPWVAGLIGHRNPTGHAIGDDGANAGEIAIEQIDLAAGDRQPSAAVDPRSPPCDLRDRGLVRIVDQRRDRGAQIADVERGVRLVIETKIIIRAGAGDPPRARPAKRQRRQSAHRAQGFGQAFYDRFVHCTKLAQLRRENKAEDLSTNPVDKSFLKIKIDVTLRVAALFRVANCRHAKNRIPIFFTCNALKSLVFTK